MAKQKGVIKLSGKLGEFIFVKPPKKKPFVKRASQKKMKNTSPAFNAHKERTAILNGLASIINLVIEKAGGIIKPGEFYRKLGERFRDEPSNERILLLDMLTDMEVNEVYKLRTLILFPSFEVEEQPGLLEVKPVILHHADKYDHNCYFLDIVVVLWNKKNADVQYSVQRSEWIPTNAPLPVRGTFIYHIPAETTDYLVACRCVMGLNNKTENMMPQQGMKILKVGSLGERERELLEAKRNRPVNLNKQKEEEPDMPRVKMNFGGE